MKMAGGARGRCRVSGRGAIRFNRRPTGTERGVEGGDMMVGTGAGRVRRRLGVVVEGGVRRRG